MKNGNRSPANVNTILAGGPQRVVNAARYQARRVTHGEQPKRRNRYRMGSAYRILMGLELSPLERLVVLAIADHCDEDGVCWPGLRRLQLFTGYSVTHIHQAVYLLEERGILSVTRGSGRRANRYEFVVEGLCSAQIVVRSVEGSDQARSVRPTERKCIEVKSKKRDYVTMEQMELTRQRLFGK